MSLEVSPKPVSLIDGIDLCALSACSTYLWKHVGEHSTTFKVLVESKAHGCDSVQFFTFIPTETEDRDFNATPSKQ